MDGADLLAREITNGMWAISGLVLLAVVVAYVVTAARRHELWWRDPAVQFAAALGLLVLGHIIRAAFSWGEFIAVSRGLSRAWGAFLVPSIYFTSIAITVLGKLLCIYALVPPAWRARVIAGAVLLTIGIPVGVYCLL